MLSFRIFIVAVCVFLAGFLSQNAFAGDNGIYKLELPDAAAVGMGGAFTGEADRPSAVYYNPAGIVQMDTIEASAGLTWLQPQIKYESSAPQNGPGYTATMKEDNYLFPDFFVTAPVIKGKFYVGLGESSDFGGGNDWEANSFSQYATVKDSVEDQDYRIVAAYKINDQWSVGGGATNDESSFEHDQALSQSNGSNGDALFKATDDSWGFDLAGMFKLNEQNQFGLDYKSPIHHDYDGILYLNNLNSSPTFGALPGGLGGYKDVFGGTSFSTEALQKITMPQSVTLGYDLKPTSKWTINFDLEWTDWAQYKNQTLVYPNISPTQAVVLATGDPQSRDWSQAWSESLGVQYAVTDKFRVRTGYSHHQTPVPEATLDTEFPDSDANAYTFGLGYDITKNLTIDIAYVADFYESRDVVNTVDNSLGAFLSGKYSAFVNVGTMSLTYKF